MNHFCHGFWLKISRFWWHYRKLPKIIHIPLGLVHMLLYDSIDPYFSSVHRDFLDCAHICCEQWNLTDPIKSEGFVSWPWRHKTDVHGDLLMDSVRICKNKKLWEAPFHAILWRYSSLEVLLHGAIHEEPTNLYNLWVQHAPPCPYVTAMYMRPDYYSQGEEKRISWKPSHIQHIGIGVAIIAQVYSVHLGDNSFLLSQITILYFIVF